MKIKVFVPDPQKLLVLPDELYQERTKGGLIIPGTAKEGKPMTGTVMVAGKGEMDIPMRYAEGDRILFSTYAGIDLDIEYQDLKYQTFKIMNQMDVMGKFIENK